jgi:hypothetical protein
MAENVIAALVADRNANAVERSTATIAPRRESAPKIHFPLFSI